MAKQCVPVSVDELNQRLAKEEEWLREFKDGLGRSNALANSVCSLLDSFQERIDSLSTNVAQLYAKSSVIQKEQQKYSKLLSTVDATIQFHGKTTALENTIRDGNVLLAPDDYLEKMRTLKEAIAFFSTHSTYRSQLEHISQIYEIGCTNIEAEFGTLVKSSCVPLEPAKLFECLDEDYEIPSFRMSSFLTLRDSQKIHQLAVWLLEHTECDQFRQLYIGCRADNLMKPLKTIGEQISPNCRVSSTQFVKIALKKAAIRIAESQDQMLRDNGIALALFLLSAVLVLVQLETDVCSLVFANTRVEADMLRHIVGPPLGRVLSLGLRVVDSYDGSFPVLFPLARFVLRHFNQLASLSENVGESAQFNSLQCALFRKCVQLIRDYGERLENDQVGGKFVPEDGNVHPVNSGTLNLLKVLVQNQKLVGQILQRIDHAQSPADLAGQILCSLAQNIRHKGGAYTEPSLGALFLFNNFSFIGHMLNREKSLQSLLQHSVVSGNISKTTAKAAGRGGGQNQFEAEADKCLLHYLEGWRRIGELFLTADWDLAGADERKTVRTVFTNFTREFDTIVEQQKNYFVEQTMAGDVKERIKALVLKPFVEFCKRNSRECAELFEADSQLKYDAETVEMVIDRLFDATL